MSGNQEHSNKAEGESSRHEKDAPDLVGEELGDEANIWRIYDSLARDEDRDRIEHWNRGLDNLALFAGLFSAVTTTFIIESQGDTKPDYARLTFQVLNATASGVPFIQEPFVTDPDTRTINCLWIASLMLSLTAALIAIMGKDWIGMYASRPACNPRQWAEIRTYRLACVERWYMPGVIASAPVLLHISLLLFSAGLVLFVAPDSVSQRLTLGFSLAAGVLYAATVLSAVVFSSSPFKSPATQAVRGFFATPFCYLRGVIVYRAKRNGVRVLSRTSLLLGTIFAHPAPAVLLNPGDHAQPRQSVPLPVTNTSRDCLASNSGFLAYYTRREAIHALAASTWPLVASARDAPALLRSLLARYRYRRQRPRTVPWHYSLQIRLRETFLSNRWTEVRNVPTPELLASSLSLLSGMSPSPEVFNAILVALGDVAIGQEVAPLVSSDLRNRLTTEIRHKWPNVGLETLSRYILADQNMSRTPVLFFYNVDELLNTVTRGASVRSEVALFALVRIYNGLYLSPSTIDGNVPDTVNQPRAMKYLLPFLQTTITSTSDPIVILASRYWQHLKHDPSAITQLEEQLRDHLNPDGKRRYIDKIKIRFGGISGLLELLTFLFDDACPEAQKATCDLIMGLVESGRYYGQVHPCLVYVFGSDPSVDGAWNGRRWGDMSLYGLGAVLPLLQYRYFKWDDSDRPPRSEHRPGLEACLARTVVHTLCPEQSQVYSHFNFMHEGLDAWLSFPELCMRCLHTLLCHSRSDMKAIDRSGIIGLILDRSALCSMAGLWDIRNLSSMLPTLEMTTERGLLNILTAIARHIARLLRDRNTLDTGSHFCLLFLSSETKGPDGEAVSWDLGEYMRIVSGRLSEQDPSTAVSMRRLRAATHVLRSLCIGNEKLRSAWDRSDIPGSDDTIPDGDYDVGQFFALSETVTTEITDIEESDASRHGQHVVSDAVSVIEYALSCLDASMR